MGRRRHDAPYSWKKSIESVVRLYGTLARILQPSASTWNCATARILFCASLITVRVFPPRLSIKADKGILGCEACGRGRPASEENSTWLLHRPPAPRSRFGSLGSSSLVTPPAKLARVHNWFVRTERAFGTADQIVS